MTDMDCIHRDIVSIILEAKTANVMLVNGRKVFVPAKGKNR